MSEQEPVREAVRAYAALQPQLASATQAYVALIQVLLDDAGIDYLSVTGRAKSVASFAAKAERTAGGRRLYSDPLAEITDQIVTELEKAMAGGMDDTHRLQQVVRRTIGRWVSRSLRRRPMIVPVVVKI